jgi:beta-glucosidase
MATNHDVTAALERTNFPADFRWGCATSAYQIEGAAAADGRGESIWDRFCAGPGRIRDGSTGAIACDHYRRWPEDLDLAQSLGLNAYRFSIAWPRVFPRGRGPVANRQGLDFYSRLVDGLLERGLEPWPTLYHWDLPQALQDRGGWKHRDTVDAFAEYAARVGRVLGDRVRHFTTHNEPWCSAFLGHRDGSHAPGVQAWPTALQVCHHILLSHGRAVQALRAEVGGVRAGIALSLHPCRPATAAPADAAAVARHDGLRNRWFLDPLHGRGYPTDTWERFGRNAPIVRHGDLATIAAPTDFIGINYYFPETIADAPGEGPLGLRIVEDPAAERTASGWEVCPEGLVQLLERVQRDYAPPEIYLTENGSSYVDQIAPDGSIADFERRRYLQRHLTAVRDSIARGVPLRGYFAWTLLDNFEWAEGYTRRFGLTHVDFDTQKRTLKASGHWYRDFLRPTTHD